MKAGPAFAKQGQATEQDDMRNGFDTAQDTGAAQIIVPKALGQKAAQQSLNQAVLYEGTVPTGTKMLVSLASSFAGGCLYCQSHMANLSSLYRAPDGKIAALADFEDSPLFTPAERAAIRLGFKAGRQPNEAGPADFDALKAHYDDGQIVEIVAAIALFGYLNRWNDTMATTLEPHALEVARRTIGPTGWVAGKHG